MARNNTLKDLRRQAQDTMMSLEDDMEEKNNEILDKIADRDQMVSEIDELRKELAVITSQYKCAKESLDVLQK